MSTTIKPDITPENVAQMLEGVTDGPWWVCIDDDGNPLSGRPSVQAPKHCDCAIIHWDGFVQEYWRSARGDKEIQANARFIAYAREAVPALAARVVELDGDNKELWAKLEAADALWEEAEARAKAAEAEVERLREALIEIVTYYELTSSRNPTMDRMAHEARAALIPEVKP
jgi:hypothetical protein